MSCDNFCRESELRVRLAFGAVARHYRSVSMASMALLAWLSLSAVCAVCASGAQAQDGTVEPTGGGAPSEATGGWQCSDGMEALLERFAALRGAAASFEEQKHIALLAVPLSSRGTVHFAAPDTLLRIQTAPASAAMLLQGRQVRFGDEAGVRSMSLAQWEAADGLIGGYLEVLRGDASGLQKHYEAKFSCSGGQWTLELRPRAPGLRKILRSMTLRGDGARLTHSELVDAHGDRTVTAFSDHADGAGRVQSPGELARRFDALRPAASSMPTPTPAKR